MDIFDLNKIEDIQIRLDILSDIRILRMRSKLNLGIRDEDLQYWRKNKSVEVLKAELEYYKSYVATIIEQAERRLGREHMAFPLLQCARNLLWLMSRKAPQKAIDYEAKRLAQAMALNLCAKEFSSLELDKYTSVYGIRKKAGCEIAFFIEASDEDDYC